MHWATWHVQGLAAPQGTWVDNTIQQDPPIRGASRRGVSGGAAPQQAPHLPHNRQRKILPEVVIGFPPVRDVGRGRGLPGQAAEQG